LRRIASLVRVWIQAQTIASAELELGATMPSFAQFVAIRDDLFLLPDPANSSINDLHIKNIDCHGVERSRSALLLFRLKVNNVVRLLMHFNDHEHIVDYNFDPPEPEATRPRSWHEVIPGNHLKDTDNVLTIAVQGEGSVEISDLVVVYHSR
jgi:hypothetical protein